jgi:stage II sporulation protein D
MREGEMRNAKTIIIGIACAMALAYIISGIYDKAVGGDNTDGSVKSGRNVCIYDNGEYSLVDVEEYTASTLAGMMSDKWSDEMLKAVAVVVRTGIYYQMDENDRNSATQGQTKNLINESQLREIRYTESQLKKKWGGECSDDLYLSILYNSTVNITFYSYLHVISCELDNTACSFNQDTRQYRMGRLV